MDFEKIVHVEKAGTLSRFISSKEKQTIRSLKITGEINAKDVDDVLDEMCSSDGHYEGDAPDDEWIIHEKSSPRLRFLDLSECNFVDGNKFPDGCWYTLLQYIAFPQGIENTTSSEYSSAFELAPKLETVILPEGLKEVGLFNGCENLRNITIPESVTIIGDHTFSYCRKLTKLYIPKNVDYIGAGAFAQSGIESFDLAKDNPYYTVVDGVIFSKDLKKIVAFPPAPRQHYDIPIGTEVIGAGAFDDCNLDTITIPDTVRKIETDAFQCSGLHELYIPDSVTEIGSCSFRGSFEMEKIRLPQGITNLEYCLSSCKKLKELDIPASVKQMDMSNIAFCESLEHIYLHDGFEEFTGDKGPCLSERGYLKEIYFPKTFRSFPGGLFHHCPDLKEYKIDSENPYMTTVDGVLYSKDLKKLIAVPDVHRKEFIIPEGVEEIGKYTFMGFRYIETISLPSTLKRIGHRAFNWCYALKEMHLPVTLSEIDYRAFDDCKSLQKLYVESKNPPVFIDVNPHWRFASDSKNLTVYVPNESVENYKKAEGWRELDIQSM